MSLRTILLEIPLKFGFMSGLRVSADVAELVDALDLGSSAARRGGSSPFIRTTVLCGIISLYQHLETEC